MVNKRILFFIMFSSCILSIYASGKSEEWGEGFFEGLSRFERNDNWGFINKNNEVIIEPIFEKVKNFSEGVAAVKFNGLWGYIDKAGNYIIHPQYQDAFIFKESRAFVYKNDKTQWCLIDKNGKIIKENITSKIHREFAPLKFINGAACIQIYKNEKYANNMADNKIYYEKEYYGFLNKDGKWILDPIYSNSSYFNEDGYMIIKNVHMERLRWKDENGHIVERDEFPNNPDFGIVNLEGEFIIPFGKYDFIEYLSSNNYFAYLNNHKYSLFLENNEIKIIADEITDID